MFMEKGRNVRTKRPKCLQKGRNVHTEGAHCANGREIHKQTSRSCVPLIDDMNDVICDGFGLC